MSNQSKNLNLGISIASFVGGIIVAAIGYIKNESTITADTKGAVFLMVLGGIMFLAGVVGMFKSR